MPTVKIKMLDGFIKTTTTPPNVSGSVETWDVGFAPTHGNSDRWALVLSKGTTGLDGAEERAVEELARAGNIDGHAPRQVAEAQAQVRLRSHVMRHEAEILPMAADGLDDYLSKLELVADWAMLDGALIWSSSLLDEEEQDRDEPAPAQDEEAIDYDAVDPLTP